MIPDVLYKIALVYRDGRSAFYICQNCLVHVDFANSGERNGSVCWSCGESALLFVDMNSANAYCLVWENIRDENKEKLLEYSVGGQFLFAWQVLSNRHKKTVEVI